MEEEHTSTFIFGSGPISAYDRSLASISLRTDRNTPGASYPIFLSATFGSQIVKIQAGSTLFEVVFEIHEAEVLLNSVETRLDYGKDYYDQVDVLNSVRHSEFSDTETAGRDASLGNSGAQFGLKRERQSLQKSAYPTLPKQYEHPSVSRLQIGRRTNSDPLVGTVVRDYQGWLATRTNPEVASGVRAELNVREHWVKFRKPSTESKTIVAKAWNAIAASDVREVAEKKALFSELLKILALKGLSSGNDPDVATLDLDAILCLPSQNQPEVEKDQFSNVATLQVDEQVLLEFLQTPNNLAAQFVRNIQENNSSKRSQKPFVPHCSVASAFACWGSILNKIDPDSFALDHGPDEKFWDYELAKMQFGRNEITDLMAVGLLERRGEILSATNPYPDLSDQASFKAFICRKDTIRFVNDILMDDPNIQAIKIGERVATYLGKNWAESSCKSNGQRLRAWTGFVFGESLITKPDEPLARYLTSDSVTAKRRGRPSVFNDENLKVIAGLKKQGLSKAQIAKELGVTPNAVYQHFKKNPKLWDDL